MNTLLRKFVEWKARRKAQQVIVIDGAAEVDRLKAGMKGAAGGIVVAFAVFSLSAPSVIDPGVLKEMERREALVQESSQRADQAAAVAEVCLNTANRMERTLETYQRFLSGP